MIEDINNELNDLLQEIVNCEDEHAAKIAEHVLKINGLYESGEIGVEDRNELLEDANQIIEVEKEAAALEAKVMLEKASKLMLKLIKLV